MTESDARRQTGKRKRSTGGIIRIGVFVTLVLVAGGFFFQNGMIAPSEGEPSATPPLQEDSRTLTVRPSVMSVRLSVAGRLEPGTVFPILSPFDGVVKEKHVPLGSHVEKGTPLLTLDVRELESRLREAKSAWVRAKIATDGILNWASGPEMSRVRRLYEASVGMLETRRRKATEAKALLERGIIPRGEYEDLLQQEDEQKRAVANALLDLEETRKRGDATQREVFLLELENTRSRLDDLETQRSEATVVATASGILVRPPDDMPGGASTKSVAAEPGTFLPRGAPLFMIADTSSFIVKARVDEMDVNHVRIGQTAEIDSDAFAGGRIAGNVTSVSAEASALDTARSPSFDVLIRFDVPDGGLRQKIRIGMSARATILIYDNPSALVVPPEVIRRNGNRTLVLVCDPLTGESRPVAVETGVSDAHGIEIVSGLSVGDEIVIDSPTAPERFKSNPYQQLPGPNS